MSASILYKFRASTTFEALPLPGSAARLFDVKKAIVLAKKLDEGGSMEFDLSIRDATTNEEYTDENMLLPRGTRLIVQRLPAARGHGFLSRMARNPYGGGAAPGTSAPTSAAPSNFYTIDSRGHAEEDEFVSASKSADADEDKELAALRAATEAGRGDMRLHVSGGAAAGPGGFRAPPRGPNNSNSNFVPRQRPNADPELREQEKQMMPKKRATGIPRTFLNLNAPPSTDGTADGDANVPLLQPNAIGFEELVNRGGGQSESASNSNRLEYALKLTATTIPEYLQCAICHNVVRDAMILPWDGEGRTTCESCIRDALTQNGFRCPLTGQEGVSPDDLLPNNALRKAAEQFVKGVMQKMEEITKQQIDDDDDGDFNQGEDGKANLLEGDNADKGVIISKKTTISNRKKQQEEDDPFAGEDDFGGDVFAVETDEKAEDKDEQVEETVKQEEKVKDEPAETKVAIKKEDPPKEIKAETDSSVVPGSNRDSSEDHRRERSRSPVNSRGREPQREPNSSRRDRRRGPPVGYSMGPAGGAALGPREDSFSPRNDSRTDGRDDRDRHYSGRGGCGGGGRGQGRVERSCSRDDDRHSRDGDDGDNSSTNNDRSSDRDRDRGTKRPRSGSEYDDASQPDDNRYRRYNDRPHGGRYDDRPYHNRYDDRRGRGGRGGYGRFDDRGGGRYGGGGGGGGGGYYDRRGRGRGRGRY